MKYKRSPISAMLLIPFFALLLLFPFTTSAQVAQELDAQFERDAERLNELSEEAGRMEGFPPLDTQVDTREVKATVTEIVSDETVDGSRQMVFTAEADGEEFTVDTSVSFTEGLRYNVKEGDKVFLQVIEVNGAVESVFLADVVRTPALLWLAALFAAVIVLVGFWRGLASLIGLAVTFGVLFLFILPQILNGSDPVLVTVIGSIVILAVNMHISHGFNRGTLLAYVSTVVGLVFTVIFANLFVSFANLSGLASEEAVLLSLQGENIAAPAGILLAAIILGAVGVLDDIAVTQSETVSELKEANPSLSRKDLFKRGMRVGRHHIASTVNTLVLAYAGVAMPLLLLFLMTRGVDGVRFLNEEPVAEEIVRTLAGTLALVLTVPISTWFATFTKKKKK